MKAIIFDVYGTLISTGAGSVEAARRILELNSRQDISAEDFYARWKQYHRSHMNTLDGFIKEEAIFRMDLEKLYREYGFARNAEADVQIMLDTLGNRTAFPESRNVLETLSGNFTICIGSTTDTEPLLEDLGRNHLQADRIFTSESLRIYKPQRAFYQSILYELAIAPSEALFVGDSLTDDVLGPQSVGMKACWVNRKGAEPKGVVPDFEIASLDGLICIAENG